MVKNLPADAGHAGWIPEWEDPLEEEMAAHYSILAWEIPWTEGPRGLQSIGSQKSQTRLSNQTTTSYFTAVTFLKKAEENPLLLPYFNVRKLPGVSLH